MRIAHYTKRGEDFPIEENIYQHVVRLMQSYKGKQDRMRKKAQPTLTAKGNKTDKVAIIDATGIIDTGLTGVVAIRVAEDLNAPTLLLQKRDDEFYGGSGRNIDNSPIEDFRALVEECPYFIFAQGHNSAFGISIRAENVELARDWFNEQLADVDMDKVYLVDFVLDAEDIDVNFVRDIDKLEWVWGTGVKEAKVVVKDITIKRADTYIQGKEHNSVFFMVNDIKFVQFNMSLDNPLLEWVSDWGDDDDELTLTVVGEASINDYKNQLTPQFIIQDLTIQD